MGSSPREEPSVEEWVEEPLSSPWPLMFLSLTLAPTHLPRAAKSPDTSRDIRQNRSATSGPIAPRKMKFPVRRTCRTMDLDARGLQSLRPPAELRTPFPHFPRPVRPAYETATPVLYVPTDQFALANSPIRLIPVQPALRAFRSRNSNLFRKAGRAVAPRNINFSSCMRKC